MACPSCPADRYHHHHGNKSWKEDVVAERGEDEDEDEEENDARDAGNADGAYNRETECSAAASTLAPRTTADRRAQEAKPGSWSASEVGSEHFEDRPSATAADERKKATWRSEQLQLRERMIKYDQLDFMVAGGEGSEPPKIDGLKYVGGADISYLKEDGGYGNRAVASLVALTFPSLQVVYEDFAVVELSEPYITGFLAFREAPAVFDLISKLRFTHPELLPQVLFLDGNGTLHPLEFGIACHVGVQADIPTIGVSKNFLQIEQREGDFLTMEAVKRLSEQRLRLRGDRLDLRRDGLHGAGPVIGAAVIPCNGVRNPIFVSVGHRVSMDTAVKLTLACSKFRVTGQQWYTPITSYSSSAY